MRKFLICVVNLRGWVITSRSLVVYLSNCSSIQTVYRPLVKRLGFEYPPGEHPSVTKLRTDAITVAAIRGDEEWVIVPEITRGFH